MIPRSGLHHLLRRHGEHLCLATSAQLAKHKQHDTTIPSHHHHHYRRPHFPLAAIPHTHLLTYPPGMESRRPVGLVRSAGTSPCCGRARNTSCWTAAATCCCCCTASTRCPPSFSTGDTSYMPTMHTGREDVRLLGRRVWLLFAWAGRRATSPRADLV